MKLDAIDRRILASLQRDGRIQNVDLAREVGLSPSPCLRRVRLLEEAGVIDRYVALLNPGKIGAGVSLFARVWLTRQDAMTIERFVAAIHELPQVVECHLMAGDCDALLRIVSADLEGYYRFQADHLSRIEGVQNVKTDVPMKTVKMTAALPLDN